MGVGGAGVLGRGGGGDVGMLGTVVGEVGVMVGRVGVVVVGVGGVGIETTVVVGVDAGVSDATGACCGGGIVTDAFGLQPGSSMDIRIRAIKTLCLMISIGLLVSDTRQPGNHIMF